MIPADDELVAALAMLQALAIERARCAERYAALTLEMQVVARRVAEIEQAA